jgi:TonB family protein
MRFLLLISALALPPLCNADLLDALKHYEQKQYPQATVAFTGLLPLGNELAAFNLAVMHYKGEGVTANPVSALAYFQLAAELGDNRATGIIHSLSKKLSAVEQQQASDQFQQLLSKVQIRALQDEFEQTDMPEVVSRKAPTYPSDAASQGIFGYTVLRFLIDEQGHVTTAEVLSSFPEKTFDKVSIKALKSWKYAATGKKHQGKVMLHYSLGPLSKDKVERLIQQHKLVEYAVAGSPQHQYLLGTLMDLLATNADYHVSVDKTLALEPSNQLPDELFNRKLSFTVRIEGFYGSAEVKTNQKGRVTEVLSAAKIPLSQASALLVGKELDEDATHGRYWLWADQGKTATVKPVILLSQLHSGQYWWSMAAKNGNLNAQRQLAALNPEWENYLLENNDPQVQTWFGVRQILQGNKTQGISSLDKAIAQQYELATAVKAAL